MKALGWIDGAPDGANALALGEILIEAEPASLRELARFVVQAAEEMERMGSAYDHMHFRDVSAACRDTWPEIVILREQV